MAYRSPHVRAEMVDAGEFMELAQQYAVYGVPKSVFNGSVSVEGAVPEPHFLNALLEAAQS